MMHNVKFPIFLLIIIVLLLPVVVLAQTLVGPNYNIENSSLDGGGETSSSPNYSSRDAISSEETGESNSSIFKSIPGFQSGAYPGIPAVPSLVNTGGVLYNSLDFIIATGAGQQSDTNYAIAISSDNFTTTNFIQTDGTVDSIAAWQSYSGWSEGTGERVTGISPNTAYKIKVKARYGPDSESGYSPTAEASTTGPTLTISISGVGSGNTIAGVITTVVSSAISIGFGSLTIGDGNPNIAAQGLTVSTNATGGYTSTVQQDNNLTSSNSDEIATVSGTNAVPATFGSGVTTGRFGYHTTDSALCTGVSSRFSSNDTYAALTSVPLEVACSTGPVTNELTHIVYKLVIGSLQQAGDYQNTITYITTATY